MTGLLAGDQVAVIADGYLASEEDSECMANGYSSLTGLLIRSGLE